MRFTNPAPPVGGPTIVSVAGTLTGGLLTAVIGTAPATAAWYVQRITVEATVAAAAYVYVGTANINANIVDGTATGQLDTADYTVPVYVPPSTTLTVVWATGTGTTNARVEYLARAV